MRQDLQLHLQGGVAIAVYLVAVLMLARHASPGIALAVGSAVAAWGVERYQAIRREGAPSYEDMAYSAAPGVAAGLAWHVVGHLA